MEIIINQFYNYNTKNFIFYYTASNKSTIYKRLELLFFDLITSYFGLTFYFVYMCIIHSINFKNPIVYYFLFHLSIEILVFSTLLVILFNTKIIRLAALQVVGTEFAVKRLGEGIPGLRKFSKLFIPVTLIILVFVFSIIFDIFLLKIELNRLLEIQEQCFSGNYNDSDFCKQNYENLMEHQKKRAQSIFQKIQLGNIGK